MHIPRLIPALVCLLPVVLVLCPGAQGREFERVEIIGDSLAWGANPDYPSGAYGFVQMLFGQGGAPYPAPREETVFTLWPEIETNNAADYGSRLSEWLDDENFGYLAAMQERRPDLVVALIGGRDYLDALENRDYGPETHETFSRQLQTLVRRLREARPGAVVVLVTYFDFFDGFSQYLPILYSEYRPVSSALQEGDNVLRGLGEKMGCPLADVAPGFLHRGYGRYLGDDSPLEPAWFVLPLTNFDHHPITLGHAHIYEVVYSILEQLKAAPEPGSLTWADASEDGRVDGEDVRLWCKSLKAGRAGYREIFQLALQWRGER